MLVVLQDMSIQILTYLACGATWFMMTNSLTRSILKEKIHMVALYHFSIFFSK